MGVVLDLGLQSLAHTGVPNQNWVPVVMSSVDFQEALVTLVIEILDERDRKVA